MILNNTRISFLFNVPDHYQLDNWLSDLDDGLVLPPQELSAEDIVFLRQFDMVTQLNELYVTEELQFDLMGVLDTHINARHCFKAVVIELLCQYFISTNKSAARIKAFANANTWFKLNGLIDKVDLLRQICRFDLSYAVIKSEEKRISSFWPLVSNFLPATNTNELVTKVMDMSIIDITTETPKQSNEWLGFSRSVLDGNFFDEALTQHLEALLESDLQLQNFQIGGKDFTPDVPLIDRVYGRITTILDAINNSRTLHKEWFDWLELRCITRDSKTGIDWTREFKQAVLVESIRYIQSNLPLYSLTHFDTLQFLLRHAVIQPDRALHHSFEFLRKHSSNLYDPLPEIALCIRLDELDRALQIIKLESDTLLSASLLEMMAIVFIRRGDFKNAELLVKKAIVLDPHYRSRLLEEWPEVTSLLTKVERRKFRDVLAFVFKPESIKLAPPEKAVINSTGGESKVVNNAPMVDEPNPKSKADNAVLGRDSNPGNEVKPSKRKRKQQKRGRKTTSNPKPKEQPRGGPRSDSLNAMLGSSGRVSL